MTIIAVCFVRFVRLLRPFRRLRSSVRRWFVRSESVRAFRSSHVPNSEVRSFVPKFRSSEVPKFRSSEVPKFVRSFQSSHVPNSEVRSFVRSEVRSFIHHSIQSTSAPPNRLQHYGGADIRHIYLKVKHPSMLSLLSTSVNSFTSPSVSSSARQLTQCFV